MLKVQEFNKVFSREMIDTMRRWLAVESRSIEIRIEHDPLLNSPPTKIRVWCWDLETMEGFYAARPEEFLTWQQLQERSVERAKEAYEMRARRIRRVA